MAAIRKRRLGKTGLLVTELGLGTLDTAQASEGEHAIRAALDNGITFIDTARIYQGAEPLIGQVLRERGGEPCVVSTKTINRTSDGAQYDIDRSMRYLGVEKIGLYMLDDVGPDSWDQVMREDGALAGLKVGKEFSLIDHLGISSHNVGVLEKAITSGEFDAVMLEYSAFYPETEPLIGLAEERGVGILAMRPLGGSGRMTTVRGRVQRDPGFFLTPAMLLRYVLSNPGVTVAVAGCRYPAHVEENIRVAASYEPLTEDEKQRCQVEARLLE